MVKLVKSICSLITKHDHIVVAVSGGPDSLCLLHGLNSLRHEFGLTLTVAHLNHQLRGTAADEDEDFVRAIADQWQLPIMVERCAVAELATKTKQSLETAARQARYDFLWRVAVAVGASKIAVGHNADDQAETVLMHFLRGTGSTGLRGMSQVGQTSCLSIEDRQDACPTLLIRPLLETTRQEILDYCQAHQLAPRQDFSNQDTTFFRNRLRHELLPELEKYNPNIRQVLRQTAYLATAEVDWLNQQLAQVWPSLVKQATAEKIELDLFGWQNLPLALKRATLRQAIQTLANTLSEISFEHIEAAVKVINQKRVGSKATLPKGLVFEVGYQTFSLRATPSNHLAKEFPYLTGTETVPLFLPGVTILPNLTWQVKIELLSIDEIKSRPWQPESCWQAYLDADIVGHAPMLRTRSSSDKIVLLGLPGHHQKIKDFMVNAKIPAAWRDHIPLLVANEQILWICGYRLADTAALRPTTGQVAYFKFQKV